MKKLINRNIEFQWICVERIGHVFRELMYHASNAKKRKKKLIVFYPNYGVKRHLNYVKREDVKLISLNKYIYFIINYFTKMLNVLINKVFFNNNYLGRYSNDFIGTLFDLFLVKHKVDSFEKYCINRHMLDHFSKFYVKGDNGNIFNSLNISPKNYIVLHVRETSYFGDDNRKMNKEADINNYIKALDYLEELNVPVVRMGDPKVLEFSHNNLINYCTSEFYSPQNDIVLSGNARFAMINCSGYRYLPYILGIPTLTVNAFPYGGTDLSKNSAVLFKKIKKNGSYLSLNESIGLYYVSDEEYEKRNIMIEENSGEEILQATKSFLDYLNQGHSKNIIDMADTFRKKINSSEFDIGFIRPDSYVNMIRLKQ